MAKKYWMYKGQKMPVKKYNPKTKQTSDSLYREAIRKTGRANKRLREIKNEFGTLGWAGSKLKEKTEINLINAWRSKGIKINKNMNDKQLKAVIKAIDNFLESKTSTVKGIKQTIKKSQESLRVTLSNEDIELTVDEAKTLHTFFYDRDFSYLTTFIPYDELLALLQDSKELNDNEYQFLEKIQNYIIEGEDEDVKRALKNIYNKYVRS